MSEENNIGKALLELDDPVISRYIELGIIKQIAPADLLSVPGPTRVSNRTIYDRCLAWGCRVVRTNGNWVWMVSPFNVRFKIRPPQQHEGNSKFEFDALLDALILPWSVFISAEILDRDRLVSIGEGFKKTTGGIEELPRDEMGPCDFCKESVVRAAMVKRGKKIAHRWCAAQAAEAKNQPKPPPDTVEPQPGPDATEEETEAVSEAVPDIVDPTKDGDALSVPIEQVEVARLPRGRYINSVFDLLVERGDPMSNRAVGEALGITPAQAGSSLAQLASQGVVNRVKSGVYQAKPGLMRKAGTMGLVISGGIEADRVIGQVPMNYASVPNEHPGLRGYERPVPIIFAGVESVHIDPSAEEDETLNELLDLMAPNGFKARHLPLIDAFKACAVVLMREVNGVE